MPSVEIRKQVTFVEDIFHEGGPVARSPYRRAAIIAVIHDIIFTVGVYALFQFQVESLNLFEQQRVRLVPLVVVGRLPHGVQELVGLPRFEEVVVDPAAVDGVDGVFEPAEAGHHDADGLWAAQTNVFQQLHARLSGELLVGQNNIDRPLGEDFAGRLGRALPRARRSG